MAHTHGGAEEGQRLTSENVLVWTQRGPFRHTDWRVRTHAAVVWSSDQVARPSSSRSSGQSSARPVADSVAAAPPAAAAVAAAPAAEDDDADGAPGPRVGRAARPRLKAEIFEPHAGSMQSLSIEPGMTTKWRDDRWRRVAPWENERNNYRPEQLKYHQTVLLLYIIIDSKQSNGHPM